MIELLDEVEIGVSSDTVWQWLEQMPEHYREWHPDHISCRWVRGDAAVPGAVMEVVERLHGRRHRLRMTLTHVEPGRRVEYRIAPGLGGAFEVEPADGGSRFTAALRIGVSATLLGAIVDRLVRLAAGGRIASIRQHQAEEGANLKALLEHGSVPE